MTKTIDDNGKIRFEYPSAKKPVKKKVIDYSKKDGGVVDKETIKRIGEE